MSLNETFPFYCANGGGKWFTCNSGTRFLGCCKRDPCQTGCAPEDRLPAYFNSTRWGTFTDQNCGINDGEFYTCAASGFLGCCKSDPCIASGGRCPYEDLGSIVLSTDPEEVSYFTQENWNLSIGIDSFHQELQQIPLVSDHVVENNASLQNPFPVSITLALALIGLVTCTSFGMLVLALLSYHDHKKDHIRVSSSAAESVPLTHASPQISSAQTSPLISQTFLASPAIPSIQLTPPLSSTTWSPKPVKPKSTNIRHSRTSSILIQAIDSTRQRPHKWAHVLIFLTCAVLSLTTTFLALLWFHNTSSLWVWVMSRNYITRFVATSTVIIRTMVDIQACVAATMLAAVFLESSGGVALADSVAVAIMRFDTTPLTLALPIMRGLAQQRKKRSYCLLSALLMCLVTTTMLLQLSSTALLMDLGIGALPGSERTRQLPIDFSYQCITDACNQVYLNQIPRISSWGMGPAFFPTFAELNSKPAEANPDVADTGMLLRAFPPYTDASARQSIQNYDGKAFVLDARVSCQAPTIEDLVWDRAAYSNFTGTISSRSAAPQLDQIMPSKFLCSYGGVGTMSVCQISNNVFDTYTGSLKSQFENNTVEEKFYDMDERPANFGTAFLVVRVLNATELQTSSSNVSDDGLTEFIYDHEWLDLKKTTSTFSAALSLSLCFAPWDAARLPVKILSEQNRSEPLTTWQPPRAVELAGSFDMSQVLHQYGIGASENSSYIDRGILNLEIPSFQVTDIDDRRPRSQRPFVQTDASEIGLAFGGANVPLTSNWTIFLCGNILPSVLTNFSYTPPNVFAADPAIANLFTSALAQSNVAWALSSVITAISATSYYNQMPAFDHANNVREVFFEPVLIPLGRAGFTAFVYVLAVHVVIVAMVVALFKMTTRLSLVGESWAAVAPLMTAAAAGKHRFNGDGGDDESGETENEKVEEDVRDMLERASEMVDDEVYQELRRRGAGKRAVRLGEGDDGSMEQDGRAGIRFQAVR